MSAIAKQSRLSSSPVSALAAEWNLRRARRVRVPFLVAFAAAAVAAGLGRAVTTTYLPVLLDRIADAPGLIGMVMLVNAAAGAPYRSYLGIPAHNDASLVAGVAMAASSRSS